MNEYAMLHVPDSQYCFATGNKELVLRLRVAKEDEDAKVFLVHGCKYEYHEKRQRTPMEIRYTDRLYHYFETRLSLTDVRVAYVFEIEQRGQKYYFCEDGLRPDYNFAEGFYNFFQMPYINENDVMPTVDWMKNAVFYQIFVDRFYRGETDKDTSYINMKWGELPTPNSFAGGDLKGITSKIDYLRELGITAVYLTPIFTSLSNHKYDTIDYMQVDPQFGSKEDLRKLVQLAHENHIHVVLDAVFNHCSMQMKQFEDVMQNGTQSPYYDWFLIDGDVPDIANGNYECFASCSYMPKLNTANEQVQKFLIEIALYWIREFGIDGWRLDVSDEVSHEFWRKFRHAVKRENPQAVIIGENWHNAYPYLMGEQYDSIMNYAFTKACLDYFAREVFDAGQMAEKLNEILMRNREQVNDMMLNLLDSHDTHRFFSEVDTNKDKLLAGIALAMLFPGAPCLYYGTETCLEGGYDPDSRRCFNWDQETWDMQVFGKVRELLHIRTGKKMEKDAIKITSENEMLVIARAHGDHEVRLYLNMTEKTQEAVPNHSASWSVLSQNHAFIENEKSKLFVERMGYAIIEGWRK